MSETANVTNITNAVINHDDRPVGEHILQFFAYGHLPPMLQNVSRPFSELAAGLMTLPANPERTVALRKLLESKDAAVRAAMAK